MISPLVIIFFLKCRLLHHTGRLNISHKLSFLYLFTILSFKEADDFINKVQFYSCDVESYIKMLLK